MHKNKYGLSRSLNAELKRTIRRRDGFGCVICGLGFYTFEHFNPEFKDAKVHDEAGICLLCFQHQGETTKGILSKETISSAVKSARCNQRGYVNAFFDLKFPIIVRFGNILMRANGDKDHAILVLGNEEMVKVSAADSESPFRLSATFKDERNDTLLEIIENEWIASVQNWDIKQEGAKIVICSASRESKIIIRANPPHELIFEELDLYNNGTKVHFKKGGDLVISPKNREQFTVSVDSPRQINCLVFNF